jgi:protein tyrosine phosphatase (PTP) superfamily phosphohydrolase (DUF442 family)
MARPAYLLILVALIGRLSSSGASDPAKIEARGLHNVFRITEKLFSGSSPDGDDGFKSLKELGVKTVISVDGAKPDVDRARKYGLRYVHIPFGYDGIPREQVLRLGKAVRDLPGLIYLHCHHGVHRGPAAAAVIHLCLDETCTVQQAIEEMRRAGTDPRYEGLYETVRTFVRPRAKELDAIPANLPEVEKVSDLAQFMVRIDARWDNLKRIKAANWKASADHPDIDPAHEALQLAELLHESGRLSVARQDLGLHRWLTESEEKASELQKALERKGQEKRLDREHAGKAFEKLGAACAKCHAKYRDVPR